MSQGIPTITLWQPWASWIAWGWKTIETRRHGRFRGLEWRRIAIHAGRRWDANALRLAKPWLSREQYALALNRAAYPTGAILCTARVQAVRWLREGPDSRAALCVADGLFGLVLADIQKLDPAVPAKGHQGVWYWTPPEDSSLFS